MLNYYFNDGRFRIFTVLAMVFSSIVYYLTVGKLVMLISEPVMLIVRTAFMIFVKILFLPIKIVFKAILVIIKNTFLKVKKLIAKRLSIRYNKREEERIFALSKNGFLNITYNRNCKKENEKQNKHEN